MYLIVVSPQTVQHTCSFVVLPYMICTEIFPLIACVQLSHVAMQKISMHIVQNSIMA